MLTRSQRTRALLLLIVLECGFAVLLVHLFQIQYLGSRENHDLLVTPHWTWVKRGKIYGRHHYELASNRDMLSVSANPHRFSPEERIRAADTLAPILDMPPETIVARLTQQRSFVWLKRKLDYQLLEPLKAIRKRENLRGLYFEREQKRIYPNGDLVPHVVGFADFDNKGIDGIERSYDDLIMCYERVQFVHQDGLARPTDPRDLRHSYPDSSNSVILTIDEMIQYATESTLDAACERWNAVAGSAIVMNPRTGGILAMANYPSLDLNDYGQAEEHTKRNRAIWHVYEPGSGFKAFTIAAALSEGTITPTTQIDCENGRFNYHGEWLHDTHPSGLLSATDVLVRSSNIGVAKISESLGIERLREYVRAFGFGQDTGIDLPYERSGDTTALGRWGNDAAGYIGFGHGISVTPLQMLTAMSAIANDGVLMKPHVVQEIRDAKGAVVRQMEPKRVRRVLSPEVANQVTQMLVQVVEQDPEKLMKVPGYRVAGKTGTAQIPEKGGYSDERYVSSFLGFLPADAPDIAVIVVIHEPKEEHLGRKVAGPVFREIATRTMELLNANTQLTYSVNFTK